MLCSSEKRRSCRSKGYVLILFALSLLVFLTLLGIAVDLTHVYLWKMRLERAAKAAAFSAIQLRATNGWATYFQLANGAVQPRGDALVTHARTVLIQNLRASFSGAEAEADFANPAILSTNGSAYDGAADQATLAVTYRVRTFILGSILGITGRGQIVDANGRFVVATQETAKLDPVAVTLVLDVSGSMACPDPACECRIPPRTCEADPRPKTIDQLVTAVQGFKDYFNPVHDYIGVVSFNLGARADFPLTANPFGASTVRLNTFNQAIRKAPDANSTGLFPRGNTNICDGLSRAIQEMRTFEAARPAVPQVVVLFSDGAPNAFVGDFDVTPPPSLIPPPADGTFYQYALEWRTPPATVYRGPSPLVRPPAAQGTLFGHVIQNNAIGPQGSEYCGPFDAATISQPSNFSRVLNRNLPNSRGCIGTLDFSIPNTNGEAGVTGVAIDASEGATPDNATKFNYARLGYFCAIEAADYIRERFQAPLFTVGVGPTGTTPDCLDPFENLENPTVRKDNFLTRVALDPEFFDAADGRRFNFETRQEQLPQCNCSPTCDAAALTNGGYVPRIGPNRGADPADIAVRGEYFGTSDGAELGLLFSTIAKQILLRLNS